MSDDIELPEYTELLKCVVKSEQYYCSSAAEVISLYNKISNSELNGSSDYVKVIMRLLCMSYV